MPVTLECAGNGRVLMPRRALSQPWLTEAVGTAEWTGTPLAPILAEAGVGDGALEVVFTGIDRGIQGGVEHDYERSLALDDALRDEVLLAYAMNGEPLPVQHGFPLRVIVPGWYGMTHVKWLRAITVVSEPFTGWQQAEAYRLHRSEDDPGEPVTRMLPRSLFAPPGLPDFFDRSRTLAAGRVPARGPRLVRLRADRARRGERRRRRDVGGRRARRRAAGVRVARVDVRVGRHAGRARAPVPRNRCRGQRPAGGRRVEHGRLLQQRASARSRARQLTASAITNTANATLMTPFIVKNAASRRRRSFGRTSVCS